MIDVLSGFFVAYFSARGRAFSSRLPTPRFLFQLFMLHFCFQPFPLRVSAQLCRFKLTLLAFQFRPVGKRGLILFIAGASGQQPHITPLLVYAGCCYVTVTIYCVCVCVCDRTNTLHHSETYVRAMDLKWSNLVNKVISRLIWKRVNIFIDWLILTTCQFV